MSKEYGRIKIEDEHLLNTIRQLKDMEKKILRAMQVLEEELEATRKSIDEQFSKLREKYHLPDNCTLKVDTDTGYLFIQEVDNG